MSQLTNKEVFENDLQYLHECERNWCRSMMEDYDEPSLESCLELRESELDQLLHPLWGEEMHPESLESRKEALLSCIETLKEAIEARANA